VALARTYGLFILISIYLSTVSRTACPPPCCTPVYTLDFVPQLPPQFGVCATMIALVLVAAADSSDSARPVRVQSHPRLRRAVPPPRLVSELVALSEAATEKSTVRRPHALEEGSGGATTSQAVIVQSPGAASSSRRLLVASLLCIFFGSFGAHHLYLGRNVAALQCLLTFNYIGLGAPLDLLRMRRYVRELGDAEAALAAGAAGPAAAAPIPKAAAPGVKGVKGGEGDTSRSFAVAAKRRRVGLFGCIGVLLRFALRMVPQYVFGRWLGTMSAFVVGRAERGSALSVWLHALGGAVAVWLSVATAGRPNAAALQIMAAAAAGPLFLEARMIRQLLAIRSTCRTHPTHATYSTYSTHSTHATYST
jgi:TM2 domain-containing membrane protein YozV